MGFEIRCLTEILPYDRRYLYVCLQKPSAIYQAVRCKIKQVWLLIKVYCYEVQFSMRSEMSLQLIYHKFVLYKAH